MNGSVFSSANSSLWPDPPTVYGVVALVIRKVLDSALALPPPNSGTV